MLRRTKRCVCVCLNAHAYCVVVGRCLLQASNRCVCRKQPSIVSQIITMQGADPLQTHQHEKAHTYRHTNTLSHAHVVSHLPSTHPCCPQAPSAEPVESWTGLLRDRYRWVLSLVLALPILQQLSGINTVVFYSSLVFASAGIRNPIAATVLVGAVNLACTFVASALMDAKGRKTLLLLSHGGMAACLVVMLTASLLASLLHGALLLEQRNLLLQCQCCYLATTDDANVFYFHHVSLYVFQCCMFPAHMRHRCGLAHHHNNVCCCADLHCLFCAGCGANPMALHWRGAAGQHQGDPCDERGGGCSTCAPAPQLVMLSPCLILVCECTKHCDGSVCFVWGSQERKNERTLVVT